MEDNLIRELGEDIIRSKKTVALTGAGISAESGIPTFRGSQGLWSKYDPAEYADIDAFMRNPAKVWVMIKELIDILVAAKPNAAHLALAELEEMGRLDYVITQNVDNLHQRAGSRSVIEYHGTNERLYCLECKAKFARTELCFDSIPPLCSCGGVIRPDVVFFGELIPEEGRISAEREAASCQLLLVLGTSAVVYPAGNIPLIAKAAQAKVIEINLEPTPLTEHVSDMLIKGPAAKIMPLIVDRVKELSA